MEQGSKVRALLCPKNQWVNDKDVSKCKSCQRNFIPLLVWKHHCRFCGNVFCSDCAGNIMTGDRISYNVQKKLRHCNPCKLRVDMALKEQATQSKSKPGPKDNNQLNIAAIEIQQPDTHFHNFDEDRRTQQNIRTQINNQKNNLQCLAISLLRQISKELCQNYGLEAATWEVRLTEIAWKAVIETKPQIFIRKEPFHLTQQIKVLTIIAPTEAVAAVCVRGLVLDNFFPSKQLDPHLKYPRIVTVRPSIEADYLMNSKQVRFDDIVVNQDKYLRGYLDPLFRLNPNIVFVQGNVSKGAMELALERKIMLVPKVKQQDLVKIERLALIRRRIENMLLINKNQIAEIIGCCERVYCKTIRQGEVLLFVEHDTGVITVLLGDTSEASNNKLKAVFDVLLKVAWNLKLQRQFALRDIKISQESQFESQILIITSFFLQKYISPSVFMSTQTPFLFKMRYCLQQMEDLPKTYQEYCKLRDRKRMLHPCGEVAWQGTELYKGSEVSLGTFLMKCAIESSLGCGRCGGQHFYRYFIDNCCITISSEGCSSIGKQMKLQTQLQEESEVYEDICEEKHEVQNSKLYRLVTKFIHAWKIEQQEHHPKLNFSMFFKCLHCGKTIGNKSKIGNDLLIMSFHHFLQVISLAFKHSQQREPHKLDIDQNGCCHPSVARVFQCPRALVAFSVEKIEKVQILPIILNEDSMERIQRKEEAMVRQLFSVMLAQKRSSIESLQKQMDILPFSSEMKGAITTISIAGASPAEHVYYYPYLKIEQAIGDLKVVLQQIEENMQKEIKEGIRDWTILMRKFAKIDHVIKAASQVIIFIINAIKKQKIQENISQLQSSIEDDISLINFVPEQNPRGSQQRRKFSEQRSEVEELTKSQSIPASYSSFAVTRMRKQTSVQLQNEIDIFLRRMRMQRFLIYQGSWLYYPIANIEDAVSLLACCLNSDEFKENLKEGLYRDNITTKLQFTKDLKTSWPPTPKVIQIYRELIKQEFYSASTQQIVFSIYYHKEFEELRISEGIDFRLYVRSLYGCQNWDSSGGKSNSTFSKAHNQTLVVKIINEKEFVEFQKFAPAYLKYMKLKRENKEESYLAKIYGIYEVIIKSKVYKCVVMQNIFFGLDVITKVYDLKGSEVNRLAQPSGNKAFTGLDTNFLIDRDSCPYLLKPKVYDSVIQTLSEDAYFLKEQGVIDYSLLAIQTGGGLRMGIIDFMRPYHFVQKIQTFYKEIKSGKDPTVIPPQQYADRFVRAIKRYFAKSQTIDINLNQ